MSTIRRTLLIFLILFSASSAAHWGIGATHAAIRMSTDPSVSPLPQKPASAPDSGEPDTGNAKTNGSGTSQWTEPVPDPRLSTVEWVRWVGRLWLARNMGIGL